jgi:hypothetical protein
MPASMPIGSNSVASTPLLRPIVEWVSFEQVPILLGERYCLYGVATIIVRLHTTAISEKQHPHTE